MRYDAQGLFWEDEITKRGKRDRVFKMAQIPETNWITPTEFPRLTNAAAIAVDVETYDPDLLDYGPGWARGKGHLVGVSIAVDNNSWYFPIRHEVCKEYNLSPEHTISWLKDTLCNTAQDKVGANLQYDLGWLRHEGIRVCGDLHDVQFAEALLAEGSDISLEAISQKYLMTGKESNLLYEWCSKSYGGLPNDKQRANIYRSPPQLVGPYAESDTRLPLQLMDKLYTHLCKENLWDLYRMECDLIYLLLDMRFAGVTVDLLKAEEVAKDLLLRSKTCQEQLNYIAGMKVDINSAACLSRVFDKNGIPYGMTAKGRPSFTGKFLDSVNHPIGSLIREIRKYDKLRGTFIESYILDSNVNGKVYCSFHPLKGEEGGTRSGRFSSSSPNLQNIPSRDEELAPLLRGMFIPDVGHKQWRKYDYSQIEYRFLIHYAVGEGSDAVREHFLEHPDTDYHEMALGLVAPKAGWDISTKELRKHWRKPVKNINFGLIYGMGVAKLSADLGLTQEEGKKLFAAYHEGVPFAKATMNLLSTQAQQLGTVTTILNRKSRFDLWEPLQFSDAKPLPYRLAKAQYGQNIKRAGTHKALNRLLQGSAADLMKCAMWKCYKDGIFDVTGVPRITVHDELDFSDMGNCEEAFREMQWVMENAIQLKIPVKAEGEAGPDWGHVAEIIT